MLSNFKQTTKLRKFYKNDASTIIIKQQEVNGRANHGNETDLAHPQTGIVFR